MANNVSFIQKSFTHDALSHNSIVGFEYSSNHLLMHLFF